MSGVAKVTACGNQQQKRQRQAKTQRWCIYERAVLSANPCMFCHKETRRALRNVESLPLRLGTDV